MAGNAQDASDRLIWLAAGVVACMGLAWLLIEAPWSAADALDAPDTDARTAAAAVAGPAGHAPDSTAAAATPPNAGAAPTAATAGAADSLAGPPARDPLYLARLALEAGMLIEPPDYSAWGLFAEAADADPGNAAAREGLNEVAAALIGRGRTALEQGRYADAEAVSATILERLPEHEAAATLAADIVTATTPPEPVAAPEPEAPAAAAAPEPVNPVPDLYAGFLEAMAQNAVLTPPGESARDLVGEMLAADPEHELAREAHDMLVTEMLDRSAQSIEALDTAAARTWIDSAAALDAPQASLAAAEARLSDHLIAQETQKLVPASALTQLDFTAPEYPETALARGIEGWVEIGFVVQPDGSTDEITVLETSHERFFDEAALAAVGEWRFEPVMFMGRAIPRRSFTRLEFVLD